MFDVKLSDLWTKSSEPEPTKNEPPPDLSCIMDFLKRSEADLRRMHEGVEYVPQKPPLENDSVLRITHGELASRMRSFGAEASEVFKRDYRGLELTWSAQLIDVSNNDGLFRTSDGESFWGRFYDSNGRDLAAVPIGSRVAIQGTLELWYIDMLYVTNCRLL